MNTLTHWLALLFCRCRRMTLGELSHAIFRERATGRSEGPATMEMRRRVQPLKTASCRCASPSPCIPPLPQTPICANSEERRILWLRSLVA